MIDDQAFFAADPARKFRVREALPNEALASSGSRLTGERAFVIVALYADRQGYDQIYCASCALINDTDTEAMLLLIKRRRRAHTPVDDGALPSSWGAAL